MHADFVQLLSLKQDFAGALAARGNGASLSIKIQDHHLPYVCRTGFTLDTAASLLLEDTGMTLSAKITFGEDNRTVTLSPKQGETFGLDGATDPHLLLHFQPPTLR